jgi:hypothetical protein
LVPEKKRSANHLALGKVWFSGSACRHWLCCLLVTLAWSIASYCFLHWICWLLVEEDEEAEKMLRMSAGQGDRSCGLCIVEYCIEFGSSSARCVN